MRISGASPAALSLGDFLVLADAVSSASSTALPSASGDFSALGAVFLASIGSAAATVFLVALRSLGLERGRVGLGRLGVGLGRVGLGRVGLGRVGLAFLAEVSSALSTGAPSLLFFLPDLSFFFDPPTLPSVDLSFFAPSTLPSVDLFFFLSSLSRLLARSAAVFFLSPSPPEAPFSPSLEPVSAAGTLALERARRPLWIRRVRSRREEVRALFSLLRRLLFLHLRAELLLALLAVKDALLELDRLAAREVIEDDLDAAVVAVAGFDSQTNIPRTPRRLAARSEDCSPTPGGINRSPVGPRAGDGRGCATSIRTRAACRRPLCGTARRPRRPRPRASGRPRRSRTGS